MPEDPVGLARDQGQAVLPGKVHALGASGLKAVRKAAAVVLELTTATEAERPGELVGLARQLRRIR